MWKKLVIHVFLLISVRITLAWKCVECSGEATEQDCNDAGTVNCGPSQHSCETVYKTDFSSWSKSCQTPSSCSSSCSGEWCVSCCTANKCNQIAVLVSTSTTTSSTTPVATTSTASSTTPVATTSTASSTTQMATTSTAASTTQMATTSTASSITQMATTSTASSTTQLATTSTASVTSTAIPTTSTTQTTSDSPTSMIVSTTTITTTTTTVPLPLSTGEQMAFLYIIFILLGPLVLSACAASCWLIYFRRKRKRRIKDEEDATSNKMNDGCKRHLTRKH